ncbi:MAG: hypothetical protein AAFZ17_09315 [Cyanobacteria bacterium J06650_10]
MKAESSNPIEDYIIMLDWLDDTIKARAPHVVANAPIDIRGLNSATNRFQDYVQRFLSEDCDLFTAMNILWSDAKAESDNPNQYYGAAFDWPCQVIRSKAWKIATDNPINSEFSANRVVPHLTSEKQSLLKQHCENLYDEHFLRGYRAFIKNETFSDSLLGDRDRDLRKRPELFQYLPEAVKDAYTYYFERVTKEDLGATKVYQLPYNQSNYIYVIKVSTDGSDGWLEVYDCFGQEIGTARTYLELICWGDVEEIRGHVKDFGFPEGLSNRSQKTLWQFGSMVVRKGSPEKFIVVAEEVPEGKQDTFIGILCSTTGVTKRAVSIMLDFLPHSITSNITREKAEDIWKQVTDIGAKASILQVTDTGAKASIKKNPPSSGFVVVKTNL